MLSPMLLRTPAMASGAVVRVAWPALVTALLVACIERPDEEPAASPPPSASPAPPTISAPPPATADAPADLSNAPARELGPIGGGTRCLEMYSVCKTVEGERLCTSAPFSLECGEEARLPSTRELLRCVCPSGDRAPRDPAADDPAPVTPSK